MSRLFGCCLGIPPQDEISDLEDNLRYKIVSIGNSGNFQRKDTIRLRKYNMTGIRLCVETHFYWGRHICRDTFHVFLRVDKSFARFFFGWRDIYRCGLVAL